MDQRLPHTLADRDSAVHHLANHIVTSIDAARGVETPFFHLEFDHVFPDDIYAQMMATMPNGADYRPMHGRSKAQDLADGTHTRVKIDLFPEYIRNFPAEKHAVWDVVGRALCSEPVKKAFQRRLEPGLRKRFGAGFNKVGMFPIPIQLYLPRDEAHTNIGTIFHNVEADGSMPKHTQMRFAPNTGYAFAVGDDTWHSADPVGAEVTTRDSILLTYFVDQGVGKFLKNRMKRIGNFVTNEWRQRVR